MLRRRNLFFLLFQLANIWRVDIYKTASEAIYILLFFWIHVLYVLTEIEAVYFHSTVNL